MASYDDTRDPAATNTTPSDRYEPRRGSALVPFLVAVAISAAVLALLYPGNEGTVGDTNNAGPSVRTVAPSPSPATSPAVPTPTPTTPGGTP